MWRIGLAIGKFDPPHLGHSVLLDAALARVERLVVFVRTYDGESIPAWQRITWLKEIHPDVVFMHVEDDPAIAPNDYEAQAKRAQMYLGDLKVDVLFSSEEYDPTIARFLGASSFTVDRDRKHAPVSSTMVRHDSLDNLQYLPPVVRAHYVKRICVIGAECVGKSTLAASLAADYETTWVPEYGKEYSAAKFTAGELNQWAVEDSLHVAREQGRREEEAARSANKLLFCDTDSLLSLVWHELLTGNEPEIWPVPPSKADFYLLLYPDVPFVPSPLRNYEHKRFWMHERIEEELKKRGCNYVVLEGEFEERDAQARAAVESFISANEVTLG